MRTGAVVLALGLIVAAVGIGNATGRKISKKDVVFIGTVTAIATANTGDPTREWVVSTSVEKVVSGSLSSSTFQFGIHSPARARIEVGQSYQITARWQRNGYRVSEDEIEKRPAARMRAFAAERYQYFEGHARRRGSSAGPGPAVRE